MVIYSLFGNRNYVPEYTAFYKYIAKTIVMGDINARNT